MDWQAIVGFGLVAVTWVVLYIIGANRNLSKALSSKLENTVTFFTPTKREGVFAAVQRYAAQTRLSVEEGDEKAGRIVLGQNAQGFHNGFWVVIYVRERTDSPTSVEVGVKSKTYQMSFALNRIRDTAVRELKSSLGLSLF